MITALKKAAAVICAGVMMFSSMAVMAQQESVPAKEEPADILLAIGAVDKIQPLSSEAPRGEYVAVMTKIFGAGTLYEKKISPFADVPQTHSRYKEICWMYDRGYIVGNEKHLFEPDRTITYGEAMKITVEMLGYGLYANYDGGYPQGYLAQASRLKLMEGVNKNITSPLTYEDIYNIVFNALEAQPYSVVDGEEPDETLMYRNFSIRRIEGIVTSDGITSIDGGTVCRYGEISIDKKVCLRQEESDFGEWLGYNVRAYIYENEDEDRIVYIYPYRTNEITLNANEIFSVEDGVVGYTSDGSEREKKLKLDKAINYIYNYKAENIESYSDIIPVSGEVSFLDNDNDGVYEVVKVYERTNIVPDYIDTNENKIFDTERGVELDLGNDEIEYTISYDSQKLMLNELEEEDVLTIYKSRDGEYIRILIARQSFEGEVTSTREEDGRHFITVGGTEYELSYDCNYLPEFGYKGDFLLNAYGEIVNVERMFGECEAFGYVLNAAIDDELDEAVVVKMFTTNGFIEKLRTAEKVKIDGVKRSKINDIYETLCPGGTVAKRPLRYKTNRAGEINLIDTLDKVGGGADDCFTLGKAEARLVHKANGVFGGDFAVNSDTSAILVPEDINNIDNFRLFNVANFQSDKTYSVEAYNFDETRVPEFLLVFEKDNAKRKGIMYVDRTTVGLDDDDEPVAEITGYVDGALQSISTLDTTWERKLSRGDVIIYYLDGKDKANDIEVWYDVETKKAGTAGGTITGGEFIAAGHVESVNGDIVYLDTEYVQTGPDMPEMIKYVYNMQGVNLYKYNTKEDTLKTANWQEIKSSEKFGSAASRMFIYTNGGFTKSAMIVE